MRYKIKHFKTLRSTNDYALELARKDAPEGLVIAADYQTHGRGRGKKKWVSPRGKNLLFTILVRPPIKANRAPLLTQVAALSVKEVLCELFPSIRTTIKKPNDVLMNGKKVCGILVESSTQNGHLDFAAVGIGLNTNSRMSSRIIGSTSIFEERNRKIENNGIFKLILSQFRKKYHYFFKNG